MNICLIGPWEGGGATYFKELEIGLKKNGHQVHLITWGNGKENKSVSRVKVIPIPLLRGLGLIVSGVLLTLRVNRKDQFDIFHALYAFPSGLIAAICGKIAKVPIVISCVGSDLMILPKNFLYKTLILWAAKSANKIICVAEPLKHAALRIGFDPEKITIIPPGVDVENFDLRISKEETRRKLGLLEKSKIILFVGRLIPVKRPDRIIRALKRILGSNSSVHLVVIGDGSLRAHLMKLSYDLGVQDHVRFEGSIPHERVPLYYAACDVLILPSDSEGLPTVILEAMASRRPVIASAVGGVPNLIVDGVNGMLIDPRDEDAIVTSINGVLSSNKFRSITYAAFRTAEDYDWKILIRKIEDVYVRASHRFLKVSMRGHNKMEQRGTK